MNMRLVDYLGQETFVDVGNLDEIVRMTITVLTGDEVCTVIYKDYSTKTFDSSNGRMADYWDDEYVIYDITKGVNRLSEEGFVNRTNSYWR